MKLALLLPMVVCLSAAIAAPTDDELRAQVLDPSIAIQTRYYGPLVALVKQAPTVAVDTLQRFFTDPKVSVADKVYVLNESTRRNPSITDAFYRHNFAVFFYGYLEVLRATLIAGFRTSDEIGLQIKDLAKGPFSAGHAVRHKMPPAKYLLGLKRVFAEADPDALESLLSSIQEFGYIGTDENFLSDAVSADAAGTTAALQWAIEHLMKSFLHGDPKASSWHLAIVSGWIEGLPADLDDPFLIQLVALGRTLYPVDNVATDDEADLPSAVEVVKRILRKFGSRLDILCAGSPAPTEPK